MKKLVLPLVIALVAVAALVLLREPKASPVMRGATLARGYGCVGCHEPQGGVAVTANPGSLRGVIPSFHSGPAVSGFWVQDYPDFREWVTQGISRRSSDDEKRLANPVKKEATIRMPAYGANLDESQIRDLYAYYRAMNAITLPRDAAAQHGLQVASEQGCFACHGNDGLTGLANPGSFKGYIPPWQGEDFHELARNDDEIREWIRTGTMARFDKNPLAHFFLARQKIHMPAYAGKISDADIDDLVSYIHSLSGETARHAASPVAMQPATAQETATPAATGASAGRMDGEALFRESGCVTCHRPDGVEGFIDSHGIELPARRKLAERLRVGARMLQEREAEARWQPSQLCHYYQLVAEQYHATEDIILHGHKAADEPGPYHDNGHLTAMPAWEQRANAALTAGIGTHVAIDAVIDQLLATDNPSLAPVRIQGWLAQASSCTLPPPDAVVNTDDPVRREQIRQRADALEKAGRLFSAVPLVTFFSDEVHLVDKVGYLRDGDVDFWLLRQSIKVPDIANMLARGAFPNEARFIVAIDKTYPVYRSYFYSNRDFTGQTATTDHFTGERMTDCYGCHVSGPRHIRPMEDVVIPPLDTAQWNAIREMNDSILSYGDVVTTWASGQDPLASGWMDAVSMPFCESCHVAGSIRAPVRRYHMHPIQAVTDVMEQDNGYYVKRLPGRLAVMPMTEPLSESAQLDLQDWIHLSERKRKRPRNKPHPATPTPATPLPATP